MKKNLLVLISIFICSNSFSQTRKEALEAHLSNCVFNDATTGSYVESYLSINPHSLYFKKQADSSLKATLIITLIFKKDGKEIAHFDKYQLETQAYKNVQEINDINAAMIDLRRNALPNGHYTIDAIFNNDKRRVEIVDSTLEINFVKEKFSFSNIELLDTFYESATKNNFARGNAHLIPMAMNYFPSMKNQLSFYTEIYPSNSTENKGKFLVQYAVVKKESGKVLDEFSNSEAVDFAATVPVLETIDISKLPSGNYELQVQALNRNNEVFAKTSAPFQRSKSLSRKSTLNDSSYFSNEVNINKTFVRLFTVGEMPTRLKTIYPVAAANEARYIDNLIIEKNDEHMRRFYYNFWVKRNPENPIAAFNEYETQLKTVNSTYGLSYKYGFETDRGRVYLQYGPPNSIQRNDHSAGLLPYEVWNYYVLDDQNNIEFIFYTRDRSSNDFILVSSNKRGEVSDPVWAGKVQGGIGAGDNFDSSGAGFNPNTSDNTLERDLNRSINQNPSGNTGDGGGINSIMNNPK